MTNLNWKARDLKKLSAVQFLIALLIIIMATFYYGIEAMGPQERMFHFLTGFEDFKLYKGLTGGEVTIVVFFWIFKALAIVIGILHMLVVNVDGQRTKIKNTYVIPSSIVACLSFMVMLSFVSIVLTVLCFNKYAAQIDEIEKE